MPPHPWMDPTFRTIESLHSLRYWNQANQFWNNWIFQLLSLQMRIVESMILCWYKCFHFQLIQCCPASTSCWRQSLHLLQVYCDWANTMGACSRPIWAGTNKVHFFMSTLTHILKTSVFSEGCEVQNSIVCTLYCTYCICIDYDR